MDVFTLKQILMSVADIAAIAAVKQLNPSFDDVKYAEAVKIAGSERWLQYHKKKGNIKGYKRGAAKNSPIFYSRMEIAAVKKAEATLKMELI